MHRALRADSRWLLVHILAEWAMFTLVRDGGGLRLTVVVLVVAQVVTQTNEEVFFKIKRNTKLSKLQGAYANKVGKDVSSIR